MINTPEYINPLDIPKAIQDELQRLHGHIGTKGNETSVWAKEAIDRIHKVMFCARVIMPFDSGVSIDKLK